MRHSRTEAALTRRRMVEAASRLFRDKGIASVSIADITSSLGLTDGGFYRHFASKEALVIEALDAASQETTSANLEQVRHLKGIQRASALIATDDEALAGEILEAVRHGLKDGLGRETL